MDYFWAGEKVRKIVRGLLIHTNNFFPEYCPIPALSAIYIFPTEGGTDRQGYLQKLHPELKNGLRRRFFLHRLVCSCSGITQVEGRGDFK